MEFDFDPVAYVARASALRERTAPAPGDTPEQLRAKRLLFCAGVFSEGCSDTRMHGSQPWGCEECTGAFLRAARRALSDA